MAVVLEGSDERDGPRTEYRPRDDAATVRLDDVPAAGALEVVQDVPPFVLLDLDVDLVPGDAALLAEVRMAATAGAGHASGAGGVAAAPRVSE